MHDNALSVYHGTGPTGILESWSSGQTRSCSRTSSRWSSHADPARGVHECQAWQSFSALKTSGVSTAGTVYKGARTEQQVVCHLPQDSCTPVKTFCCNADHTFTAGIRADACSQLAEYWRPRLAQSNKQDSGSPSRASLQSQYTRQVSIPDTSVSDDAIALPSLSLPHTTQQLRTI